MHGEAQAVLLKTMTLEVCDCLNMADNYTDSVKIDSIIAFCFGATMAEHNVAVKDSLGIDLRSEEGQSEMGALFMYSMMQDCTKLLQLITQQSSLQTRSIPNVEPLTKNECEAVKKMSFNVVDDSTLVPAYAMVFVNNHLTEYTMDGSMTADYKIVWKNGCAFDAYVVFSSDKALEELKTSNRPIAFEFIGKQNGFYYLKMNFFGVLHVFKLQQD